MPKFVCLNDGELRRLILLGKEEQRLKAFSDDDIYWDFMPELGGGWIAAALKTEAHDALAARRAEEPKKIEAHSHHVKRWADAGYIDIAPWASESFRQFILTPRGREFMAYQTKPPWWRWLDDTWADLRPELRAMAFSIIASVIASLVFTAVALRLGLIHQP
jgi:hypothetical protein